MIGKIAVVLDSASYLPQFVRDRYGAVTVPLTVVIDRVAHQEFVDLDSATFYRSLASGATVSTSQPSPGRFLEAFDRARDAGAEQIVAILIGSALSGTVNSARIAAQGTSIPVRIIDTGQASFIEGLCAWEACETLAAGATIEEAEAATLRVARTAGNIFIVRGLELLKKGGRMEPNGSGAPTAVPILAYVDGSVRPVGAVTSIAEAMDTMVSHLSAAIAASSGQTFRVGISNGAADELAATLEARVRTLPRISEIVPYEVGPAVGAHTGPGCTGIVFVARPV